EARLQLQRELHLLADKAFHAEQYAGDVTSGPGLACNQAEADWISEQGADDRYRAGQRSCGDDRGSNRGKDHVWRTCNELSGKCGELIHLAFGIAVVDLDVLAIDIAEFLQTALKGDDRRIDLSCHSAEDRDALAFRGILGARRQRRRSHASQQ